MTKNESVKLQKLLKLISNENKFEIIRLMTQGEICVCDIGEKLGIEQSLVSHHLNSLRKAGLINDRKLGKWTHCSLNKKTFSMLTSLFSTYFGQNAISEKMCSVHEECKCLVTNFSEKNEK